MMRELELNQPEGHAVVATIQTLAIEYGLEPYEVVAALAASPRHAVTTMLDKDTEVEFREALDGMADQAESGSEPPGRG